MKEINLYIKTEHIQALLEGKRLILDCVGQPRIVLTPDRHGVFMTFDKFAELRRKIMIQTIGGNTETVLKEIFGEELYEKVMTEKPNL